MIGEPTWGPDGLVPVVAQDEADGRVLMVAYMDAEALAATLASADLHFHSRSRGRLWRKGETSGNTLRVVDLALDCDGDAVLATVRPAGPTCHRGTRSCFDAEGAAATATAPTVPQSPAVPTSAAPAVSVVGQPDPPDAPQGFARLEALWATIDDRRRTRPAGSWTVALLEGGVDAVARKVTEEATEVLIAAKDDAVAEAEGADRAATAAALASEAADLLYHLLVLLAERDLAPGAVVDVLATRRGEAAPATSA
ncbi:MAG: bifunctional phosphoribosyl-AMP cyclohydrolase/phosphoribosyl-ATP diphosphatase HisIE [Chloroflexi bacterium]|nr:bifunctional phosphoribosyl-AMP cyclohydrolase/phosphoribosyl-ATP diphosphatase HisIE [Chloroflexota bacterium]